MLSADRAKAIRCCWPNNINGDSGIKYCSLSGGLSMDYAFLVDDCMSKSPNGRKIV